MISDMFLLTCDLPGGSNSSWRFSQNSVEHGGFNWRVECRYNPFNCSVTLGCQPVKNNETLLWRCDAKAAILSPGNPSPFSHLRIAFDSLTKPNECKTKLLQSAVDVARLQINVEVIRSFIIDLSSPSNELIFGADDAARFYVDGRIVFLSKKVLTRCSPVFESIFFRDLMDKNTGSYTLRDVNFHQVMHLMAIVNRKSANIAEFSVGYLATLAVTYENREILELCKAFLQSAPEELENTESTWKLCSRFDNAKTVIDTKSIRAPFRYFEFKLGEFLCQLTGGLLKFFPLRRKRSVLWRCVAESTGRGVDQVVHHRHSTFNADSRADYDLLGDDCKYNFSTKLIESDVIDLSSPENEFVKDPKDAVCLKVGSEQLWFSKTIVSLGCPPLRDLFQEAKDVYAVDAVNYTQFLHFMAILHSNKFAIDDDSVEYLLEMAERFRCGYVTDRCESFLRNASCGLNNSWRVYLAFRYLGGLTVKP